MLTRRGIHESTISFAMFLDVKFPELVKSSKSLERAMSTWSSQSRYQDVGFKIFVAKEILRVSLTSSLGRCIQVASTQGPERLELIMEKDLALCDCTACLLRLMSSSSGTWCSSAKRENFNHIPQIRDEYHSIAHSLSLELRTSFV